MDLLHQYVGRTDPPFDYPSEDLIDQYELQQATADFANLPMFFFSYHGPTSARKVLDAMDHSVEVDGVQHIVLDNLQFIVGESSSSQDDALLSRLRSFATERNVHVTLVVHPRRESEKFLLDVSGLPGSGKIIQEADNIWILQRYQDGSQSIQVKKNRYDGDIGESLLVPAINTAELLDHVIVERRRGTSQVHEVLQVICGRFSASRKYAHV